MDFIKKHLLWVIAGAVVFLLVVTAGYYNSFVAANNAIDGQWKQVEVQYQRRFDLIPNLVEATKGIMQQEQTVFGNIAAARANYAGAQTPDQKVAAANQVESALGRLLAIVENYPQLKSDQAVLRLQDELAGTENRIAVERRRYNDLVQQYNTNISTIPGNIFAGIFGFKSRQYFNATPGSENAPQVKF
ncbi:LemA family protein [Patescibacteria group bacterium]|nr:LemA family protein [Patescibacteria group bacterium]